MSGRSSAESATTATVAVAVAEAIMRLLVTNGLRVSEVCATRVELLEREAERRTELAGARQGRQARLRRAERAHRPAWSAPSLAAGTAAFCSLLERTSGLSA
jgi:hypothetical protein